MSKKTSFSPSKAAKAALGTNGFIPHTPELLRSEAWRGRSIRAVRILDRLELEHLAHAGKENGFLSVTHRQFVECHLSSNDVKPGIEECVARGLLIVTHQGGYSGSARDNPSRYQLTYLPWKLIPATGPPQYLDPTHDWKSFKNDPNQKNPKRKRRSATRDFAGHYRPVPQSVYRNQPKQESLNATTWEAIHSSRG